jgi:hypothetical protein
MAIEVTRVEVWSAEMPDQAGALDRILGALADAGANLECVIGRRNPENPGSGHVYVTPIKGRKVQNAARAAGLKPAENIATLRVETPNKTGQGHLVMRAIAQAGLNVRGVSAVSIGTKSIAYIGLDSREDADRAIKALKAAGKAAPSSRKTR